MPIDYPAALNLDLQPVEQIYTPRDAIVYALGIGFGAQPTDPVHLRYVYERDLKAFPTMAVVLGFLSVRDIPLGIDYARMVHAEQELELFEPLPTGGHVSAKTRVANIWDRGAKGALIRLEREITNLSDQRLLARSTMTVLCRADGGFGGPALDVPAPRPYPTRAPDLVKKIMTVPQQALIYRLSGDVNPLHVDPAAAQRAGFPSPILHGLATFGLAGRAVAEAVQAARDGDGLRTLQGRFLGPVHPGETLRFDLWDEPEGWVLRATVVERDAVAFGNGLARLR